MIGAVVFVIGFLFFVGFTITTPKLPPAESIYALLNLPPLPYEVLGLPAWLLINAIFNGVIWAFLIWLVFSIFKRVGEKKREKRVS